MRDPRISPSSRSLRPSTDSSSGTASFQDNRSSTAAQRELQGAADRSSVHRKAVQLQAIADQFNSGAVFQLQPQKKAPESDIYIDPDFPLLEMKAGAEYGEYFCTDTKETVFYEAGEGYYTDIKLTQKADMSRYLGDADARDGIDNYGGKSYYYRTSTNPTGFLPVMQAFKLVKQIQHDLGQSMDDLKDVQIKRIGIEIQEKTPIHPIQLERTSSGLKLFQGRHRIVASMLSGIRQIPFVII